MSAVTAVRIGCKVRCFVEDISSTPEELKWHIGDEFVVTDIHIAPYGTFLCNYKGQNLNIKRAEFVDANIEENLESIRLLSVDVREAKRIRAIYSNFIGEFEDRERRELWAWLKKENRENEFEAIAECAEDYAGDQRTRLRASDAMDEIMKEFEQSRR